MITGAASRNNMLIASAGFLMAWLLYGYRYFVNSGIEVVPIIKRIVDPAYMSNDYYLNLIATEYNHRLVFTNMVARVAEAIGSVEMAMAIIYILFLFLTLWGVAALATRWTQGTGQTLLAVLIAIVFWYAIAGRLSPGSVSILQGELTPNVISRCLLVWALVFTMDRKIWLGGLLAILAATVQPLDGLLTLPLILMIGFFDPGINMPTGWQNKLLRAAMLGALVCAVIVGLNYKAIGGEDDSGIFIHLATGRLSHHYDPASWPLVEWVFLGILAVAGTLYLFFRREKPIAVTLLVTLAGFVIYLGLLLATDLPLLYKLQGAKMLWGNYLLWGLLVSIGMAALIDRTLRSLDQIIGRKALGGILALGLLAGGGGALAFKEGLPTPLQERLDFTARTLAKGNYRTAEDYAAPGERELAAWARNNTPADAVILHPSNLQFIRPLAERASVVQSKLAGFSAAAMRTWDARMKATDGYCKKSLAELRSVALTYDANFIAVPAGCTAATAGANPLHTSMSWIVFEARP